MYLLGMRKREFPVFQNLFSQSHKPLNTKGFQKLKESAIFQLSEPLDLQRLIKRL